MFTWQEWLAGGLSLLAAGQLIVISIIHTRARKREELFQIIAENAADMIALVDTKGRRLYNSPAYKRILGYSPGELSETSAFEQIHPDDRFRVLEASRAARDSGVGATLEYRIRHKDGSWKILESSASTIRNQAGEVAKLVIVNRDITEKRHAREQLEHNALHDGLTGLPNRRLFLERLQQMFVRTQRNHEEHYAVLLLDVDQFKVFNETLGQVASDQIIVEVGRRLWACVRQDDTISRPHDSTGFGDARLSRMGGDEFTILLEATNDPSNALRVARRLQQVVAEPMTVEGREIRPLCSVGIALSTRIHQRAEDILQDAETAMRRAKGMGGSRSEVFDEAMHTSAVNRLLLENELREAIDKHEFRIHYQPMLELESRRVVGFEALLRWQHPQQGLISPTKFLDAAEDTGLLVAIGQWMLLETCQQLGQWSRQLHVAGRMRVAVNISAGQFAHPGLVADIKSALQKTGIEPGGLSLEMTEGVVMANPARAAHVLAQLRTIGVGVVLDDFGAAHSSLRELRDFPIEAVKIAQSLTHEMQADRGRADIAELIILLAHKLNLRVIAEGIETMSQLERLRSLGCEFGQGYLFSPPVTPEAAEQLLQTGVAQAMKASP
jgi:diguanylate cyclase (GGDEF)-like protein/PAS domain S-box-containing protein